MIPRKNTKPKSAYTPPKAAPAVDTTKPIPVTDRPFAQAFHTASRAERAAEIVQGLGYEWDAQQLAWVPPVMMPGADMADPKLAAAAAHLEGLGYKWNMDAAAWSTPLFFMNGNGHLCEKGGNVYSPKALIMARDELVEIGYTWKNLPGHWVKTEPPGVAIDADKLQMLQRAADKLVEMKYHYPADSWVPLDGSKAYSARLATGPDNYHYLHDDTTGRSWGIKGLLAANDQMVKLGYTWHGADAWKPPLGPNPGERAHEAEMRARVDAAAQMLETLGYTYSSEHQFYYPRAHDPEKEPRFHPDHHEDPIKTVMAQARKHLLSARDGVDEWVHETVPGYEHLLSVLLGAYDQAAKGKGKERHANERAFSEQPIHLISQMLDSTDGQAFQAIKKIQESTRMTPEKAVHELRGAIVYTAAMIMALETYLGEGR